MEMFALAFHLIIISWVHLFVVLGHAATVGEEYFQLDGNCGIFEPDIPRKQLPQRIVNGYKVKRHRPWMVQVSRRTSDGNFHIECGGTLISQHFVLTAGHCFCGLGLSVKRVDCSEENVGRGKVLIGEAATHYLVFLGSISWHHASSTDAYTDVDVDTNIDSDAPEARHVSRIVVHHNMKLRRPYSYDLAIIRLARPIGRYSENVLPICLPFEDSRDLFQQVFVTGWGILRPDFNAHTRLKTDSCATTQFGPQKFKQCHSTKGQSFASSENCQKDKAPPQKEECKAFFKTATNYKQFDIYLIGNTTACYAYKKNGINGWCYTRPEGEAGVVDWGFCFPSCNEDLLETGEDHLREVSLEVLHPSACRIGVDLNISTELCVGHRLEKPLYAYYSRTTNGQYALENVSSYENLNFTQFKDSCQGDSGGPVFHYEDSRMGKRRAVLLGVISRGNGCAQRNQPGKATRVAAFMPWIRRVTSRSLRYDGPHSLEGKTLVRYPGARRPTEPTMLPADVFHDFMLEEQHAHRTLPLAPPPPPPIGLKTHYFQVGKAASYRAKKRRRRKRMNLEETSILPNDNSYYSHNFEEYMQIVDYLYDQVFG